MAEISRAQTSAISPEGVATGQPAIMWVDQVDGDVWWVQSRTEAEGRYGLFRATGDGAECLTAPSTSVRSRVHEYGGRSWAGCPDGRFCFVEWSDQRMYVQTPGGPAQPISPVPDIPAGWRHAEPVVVGDEVWTMREEFHSEVPTDVTRDFVALPLDGSAADDRSRVRVLSADTHHFLAGLRISPDGTKAAWIGWDHPYMPWDRSDVVVADVVDGVFVDAHIVASGAPTPDTAGDGISICQVEWESDDTLVYLSDVSGWFNLYRQPIDGQASPVLAVDRELGGPMWQVGQRWFAIVAPGQFAVLDHGTLCRLSESAATLEPVPQPDGLTTWRAPISAAGGQVSGIAYGARRLPTAAVVVDGEVRPVGGFAPLPVIDGAPVDPAQAADPGAALDRGAGRRRGADQHLCADEWRRLGGSAIRRAHSWRADGGKRLGPQP